MEQVEREEKEIFFPENKLKSDFHKKEDDEDEKFKVKLNFEDVRRKKKR